MHITRLRLLGFKSFVEATELHIEQGLTGVLGPNGCGKSNLLEALRWAMGETSYKSMRASTMEDVIFAGTTTRPARNWAEVTMFVDNSARTAPPEFNDHDVLEITRRIERDMGSAYRVNGRDVRARDVKVLFEDAATGARSPALVRQGQIGEIVNAKPEQRRRILEDAAGVAGLHTRRHEAELRLKAAEDNLARIGDVLGGLSSQMEGLKRQARQARRYKELSGEIRRAEALALHLAWTNAEADVRAGEGNLREALIRLAEATETEAAALAEEAALAETLAPLREAEAVRGATVARLRIEQEAFEKEAERLHRRQQELDSRLHQLAQDLGREEGLFSEAGAITLRLAAEAEAIAAAAGEDAGRVEQAAAAVGNAETVLGAAEARLGEATRRAFEAKARRKSLEAEKAHRQADIDKARRSLATLGEQRRDIAARAPDAEHHRATTEAGQRLLIEVATIEAQTEAAEDLLAERAHDAALTRDAAGAARLEASRLATEIRTLSKLLVPIRDDDLPPVIDQLKVAPGYEAALGAALGDDLDAPVSNEAGVHWRLVPGDADDPGFAPGIVVLGAHVEAPDELARRLAHVGVVPRADGRHLQSSLKPGQRLVSMDGDLWRWDGFVAAADAPSAAALRLAERNRLGALIADEASARASADGADQAAGAAARTLAAAEGEARRLRQLWRDTQAELARVRDALAGLEAKARETESRLAAAGEAQARTEDALAEATERWMEAETALETLDADEGLDAVVAALEDAARSARATLAEHREAAQALARERRQRSERLDAIRREQGQWAARRLDADRQREALAARRDETATELESLSDLPEVLDERRQRLMDARSDAERQRQRAADQYAGAEAAARRLQATMRAAQGAVSEIRELRARCEAHLEGARTRLSEEGRRIRETLDVAPQACLGIAGLEATAQLAPLADVERQLGRLKTERDRLGGVNLSAEDDLAAISEEHAKLDLERGDVEGAVAKLRGAIGQLNREAKKRLGDAFRTVDQHFRRLFESLFGGGEARLEMIESEEDPLEGGLEIIAKPPGKKPATLSLLSGGEQTLTALSLIFAVFLTNPSPICVLDEVDAPLDDSNVDRFCTLMEKMASETATRFLVITHHPMTMARMNRLFGVTMGEKGVSQLVSVDLATAERIIESDDGVPRQGVA